MDLAKPYIQKLAPYQPGLPVETVAEQYGLKADSIIKLNSNENPNGPSPAALSAVKQFLQTTHRYPDTFSLGQALSKQLRIPEDTLIIGNGSNDIIDLIARTFLGVGDESIISQYAFAMYHVATQTSGASSWVVPAKEYGHDLDAMKAAINPKTKILWIANPNNPTGTFIPHDALEKFIKDIPSHIIIALDEAYYEYLQPTERGDTALWPLKYPNIIIIRTFSKIYGIAGLRVGYGIAPPNIAALINRVRLPFTNNGLGIAAATAALHDHEFVTKSRNINTSERTRLEQRLRHHSIEFIPSKGNFITLRIPNTSSVYEKLMRKGIAVRPLANYDMHNWLRVSIGLPKENDYFIHTLIPLVSRAKKK